jgi:hypothetical protein
MGAFCMACLDGDRHRRDVHSRGSGDYGTICMAILDGVEVAPSGRMMKRHLSEIVSSGPGAEEPLGPTCSPQG